MRCKKCGESFPLGQSFGVWELRRQTVTPIDAEGVTANVHLEDAGVFCSRQCLQGYLKAEDRSGLFDLGGKKA